jgi:hypothetical protein
VDGDGADVMAIELWRLWRSDLWRQSIVLAVSDYLGPFNTWFDEAKPLTGLVIRSSDFSLQPGWLGDFPSL